MSAILQFFPDAVRDMSRVVNEKQYARVQSAIKEQEGKAEAVMKPGQTHEGLFIPPTIVLNPSVSSKLLTEEIFGPVLSIIPYDDDDEAIRIANDTPYGLSGYVSSGNQDRARRVASRMRTGMVHINGADLEALAPFGGYKQSGNGREWGAHGIDEFLEVKSVYGYEK